jgi:aspartyl-tRNA(Asn)/glutamyl-tRNA(Gln) amidotransferase subunit C
MIFTKTDVLKVAKLARLSLTEEEISRYQKDLERILGFIEQLQEVDVSSCIPMSHAGKVSLPLREDIVVEALGRECVKSSAGYEDGLVRVPKIID